MTIRYGRLALFGILFLGLACVVATPSPQNPVATAVAETMTAKNLPGTPASPMPTSETTAAVVSPTPTVGITETAVSPSPACLPAHPGAQSLPLPAGVAAGLNESLALKTVKGNLLADRPVTGMTFLRSGDAHLAGPLSAGAGTFPIVYFSLQGGGKLRLNSANALSDIGPAPELTALIGVEGGPFIVYAILDMMHGSANRVYAGAFDAVAGSQPVITWSPPADGHYGNAIRPLAVHAPGGAADGFWFTYTMVGIGDINYPPYNGLYFHNLATQQDTEFVPTTDDLGGISPDQTTIAYGAGQGGKPGLIRSGFTLRNLVTCQETYIGFNPASNLGGGWMVFTPDDRFVAWTEASGPSNMEATFRMRVARSDGVSLFDAPIANLTSFLGGEQPTGLRPVGWIANHLLVMEMTLEAIHHPVLVVWAPDPSQPLDPVLGANQSAPIADGNFIGFVYP